VVCPQLFPPRKPGTLEVWSHLVIAEGVELTIDPGRAGLTPEQVRALAGAVMDQFQRITLGEPGETS
jgi:hypothetical protein